MGKDLRLMNYKLVYSSKKYTIVTAALLFVLVITGVYFIVNHGGDYTRILFVDRADSFMDFFHPINHASNRNPYGGAEQIYPPICYVFFYICSRFIPMSVIEQGGKAIRDTQEGRMLFFLCAFLLIWMELALLRQMVGYKYKAIFIFAIMLSTPLLYAFDRGNIIFLAFVLAGHFILYKDSDNKIMREWALIALALAACIKIYPAIIAAILMKEQRWKEFFRVVLYAIIIFFVPFLVMGGFEKIIVLLHALTSGVSGTSSVEQGPGYKVNFTNSIVEILGIFNGGISEKVYAFSSKIGMIVSVLAFIAIWINKRRWETLALLSCLIVGAPGFNFQYAMIFMVYPLIMFLNEEKKEKGDGLFLFLYLLQFVTIGFVSNELLLSVSGFYPVTINVFLEGTSVLLMTIILVIKSVTDNRSDIANAINKIGLKRIISVFLLCICVGVVVFSARIIFINHGEDRKNAILLKASIEAGILDEVNEGTVVYNYKSYEGIPIMEEIATRDLLDDNLYDTYKLSAWKESDYTNPTYLFGVINSTGVRMVCLGVAENKKLLMLDKPKLYIDLNGMTEGYEINYISLENGEEIKHGIVYSELEKMSDPHNRVMLELSESHVVTSSIVIQGV